MPEEYGVVGSILTVTTKKFRKHKYKNMKAILEFNLPDDQQDFELATKGLKFWSILWDLDQSLRSKTKYASDDLPQDKYDAYQEIRNELHELMSENMISFDMVH